MWSLAVVTWGPLGPLFSVAVLAQLLSVEARLALGRRCTHARRQVFDDASVVALSNVLRARDVELLEEDLHFIIRKLTERFDDVLHRFVADRGEDNGCGWFDFRGERRLRRSANRVFRFPQALEIVLLGHMDTRRER